MTETIDIAIVEDNDHVRTALEDLIRETKGCRWVGSSANGEQALENIPKQRPHVVVMDLELPGISGIDCTARLKGAMPELQILVLTVFRDGDQIFRALEAGASGYLLKRSFPREIIRAIREVSRGGAPMSAEIARKVVDSFHRPSPANSTLPKLTPRESEIIALLAGGFASKEIASRLGIAYDTVCGHITTIYRKLHVRCRTEAVVMYLNRRDRRAG